MIKAKDKLVGVLKNKQKLTSKLSIGTIREKYAPRYIKFYQYSGTELNDEIKNLDTSNLTSMSKMFSECGSLKSLNLGNFDTSNVTNMYYMFSSCQNLTSLDLSSFNTSKVTTMASSFYDCRLITDIPEMNASLCTRVDNMFYNCKELTNFGGLKDLGASYGTNYSENNNFFKLNLSYSTKLTEQSLINVLNNLYDIKTRGCKTQSVVLGSTNLAKLTSDEGKQALQQAQDYGWTVT